MILRKYVKEKGKGISLGLECHYRATKIRKQYVIYRMSDGKIVEKIPHEKIKPIYEDKMLKRLHEINKLEIKISEEMKNAIDSTN